MKQTVSSKALQEEIRRKQDTSSIKTPNPNTEDRNQQLIQQEAEQRRTPPNQQGSLSYSEANSNSKHRSDEDVRNQGEPACCSFQFTQKVGRLVEATDPTVASTATQITLEKVMPPSEVVLQSKLLVSDFSPSPPNHSTSPERTEESPTTRTDPKISSDMEQPKTPSDGKDVSMLKVGSRVAIYWDGEQEYFKATIKKHDASRAKPFFVRYDDGDREWTSLENERFRILKTSDTKKRKEAPGDAMNTKHQDASREDRPSSDREYEKPHLQQGQLKDKSDVEMKSTPGSGCDGVAPRDDKENLQTKVKETKILCEEGDWITVDAMKRSGSDSDTDEEELTYWAHKMLGAPLPVTRKPQEDKVRNEHEEKAVDDEFWGDAVMSISEKVKLGRHRNSVSVSSPSNDKPLKKKKCKRTRKKQKEENLEVSRKQQAKPLTSAEIQAILKQDCSNETSGCSTWVRRSMRQPSRSALDSPRVKDLIHKLSSNDPDMVVLKMKKYCSDLDTPQIVIDAVLDALEENRNCEALYIQVCDKISTSIQINLFCISRLRTSMKVFGMIKCSIC